MARSVIEIEPGPPQGVARQRVDLRAGRSLGENDAGDRDMALEHAREAVAHLGARTADGDRARDVGRSVLVLAAAVDEEEAAPDLRDSKLR